MTENKTLLILLSATIISVLVLGTFFIMGGIVNTSSSIPPGLYWKVDKPLTIGKTVAFCPPNRPEFQEARNRLYINDGACPDNFDKMILKVAAKYKDKVTINANGVYVNGILHQNSKPLAHDREGRPMASTGMENYELKENEILLMSDSDDDPFDGRYFGLINVEQVDSVIHPILP